MARRAFAGIGDSRLTVLDEECTRIGCGVAHEYWIAREARNAGLSHASTAGDLVRGGGAWSGGHQIPNR